MTRTSTARCGQCTYCGHPDAQLTDHPVAARRSGEILLLRARGGAGRCPKGVGHEAQQGGGPKGSTRPEAHFRTLRRGEKATQTLLI